MLLDTTLFFALLTLGNICFGRFGRTGSRDTSIWWTRGAAARPACPQPPGVGNI
jgi:hypothetical protein